MFGNLFGNWKTSLSGLIAAIAPWLSGVWPEGDAIIKAVGSLALALFAYFAADKK